MNSLFTYTVILILYARVPQILPWRANANTSQNDPKRHVVYIPNVLGLYDWVWWKTNWNWMYYLKKIR